MHMYKLTTYKELVEKNLSMMSKSLIYSIEESRSINSSRKDETIEASNNSTHSDLMLTALASQFGNLVVLSF